MNTNKNNKRPKRISIYMNAEEGERFEKKAREVDLPAGIYARLLLREAQKRNIKVTI